MYKDYLDEELYKCYKRIGIPYETLYEMPIQQRRNIIHMYNKETEEQNRKYKEIMNKK